MKVLVEDYEFLSDLLKSKLGGYEKEVVLGSTGILGYDITSIITLHFASNSTVRGISVVGVSRNKDHKIK
jgi:hypothetical protein